MKNELKKKIYTAAAAASRLERLIDPVSADKGSGAKGQALNELIHAVQQLSPDARQLLEEMDD